jgi:tight adherence protein B
MRRSLAAPTKRSCRLGRGGGLERLPLIRILLALSVVALLAPVAATASVTLRRLDPSGYPTIRATLVAPVASDQTPTLTENGRRVVDLTALNLSASKSVVIAVDRSRSMAGKQLDDATAAARKFLAAKAASDRVAVVVFGSKAVQLTRFSSSTIDAADALGTMAVDSKSGTALNDAVALSASLLSKEQGRARVVVLLTDGQDVSSTTSFDEAVASAHKTSALIYPISVGASDKTKQPLQKLALETGGAFNSAASSKALSGVYSSVAAELRRTWRLEYVTAARPGEKLHLRVSLDPEGAASSDLMIPGTFEQPSSGGGLLPDPLYTPLGGLVLTMLVAFLVLTACGFLLTSAKGSWVKTRLAPHLEGGPRKSRQKKKGQRLAAFAGLFRATEQAFGHRRVWMKLQVLLERADVPLRTVEFAYLMLGCAFVVAFFAVASGRSSLGVLIALCVGAAIPYMWVSFKAKRRMNAFENQLPDLLVTLAASLKAGHSFKQGLQTVVDEGQEPASKELGRVITDTRLGRPMDEALSDTAERIGSKNFSFVITAVSIQRQVGGSLAGLFDMVADTVRQRQQFARKIKGLTAMGRASAYVLIGLPFFVAFALTVLNPTYMDPLYHSSTGHTMIMIGLAMMAFGSLILKKLVSFRG